MEKEFVLYESPFVEIIEVEVEKGFAASTGETEVENLEPETW